MGLNESGVAYCLNGVTVLDFSRFLAGPICGMLLAAMGATVIRIEKPGGGIDRAFSITGFDGESLLYKTFGRNKKGITLDLNCEKGKEILGKLVMKSDVVLHNFTPGSPESGYLQYNKLKKVNPKIIVTAVSSYGKDGPYAKQVGLDFSIQGISGSMWINGFPGEPPVKNSIPGIDVCTALSASLGTMFALYYREKTGIGQEVDTSLFDSALFLTQSMGSLMLHAVFNENRTQVGNFGFSTYMSCLRAKDGWVMVVPTSNDLWRRLARAIGREDMADDPRFQSDMDRCKHTDIINPVVEAWVAERSVTEVTTVLKKYRVPCDPVITVAELLDDPQAKAREMVINMEDPATGIVPMPGLTIKLSQTPGHLRGRAPVVGEHNEEIYCNLLGLEAEQLRQLEQEGVI